MKTSELTGVALDWAVAKSMSKDCVLHDDGITRCIMYTSSSGAYRGRWEPSTNWEQGGPIIDREDISIMRVHKHWPHPWCAERGERNFTNAATPLIAAMRCYVASKLGDEVAIPF